MTASVINAAVRPLAARTASFGLSAFGSLFVTRQLVLILGHDGFAAASLIIATTWMAPILTNGSSVNIVKAVSGREAGDGRASCEAICLRSTQTQFLIALGIAALSVPVALFVPNRPAFAGLAGASTLALITGLSIAAMTAASTGGAVFQGLGRQTTLSALPALTTAVGLLLLQLPWPRENMAAASVNPISGALMSVSLLLFAFLRWRLPFRSVGQLLRARVPSHPTTARVFLPATIVAIAAVLFSLSDRFILTGRVSGPEVASYVAAQQITAPAMALTATAAGGMWAYVERARAHQELSTSLGRTVVGVSTTLAILLGLATACLGPYLVRFMTEAPVSETRGILAVLGISVTLMGVADGAATLQRTRRGLRRLAWLWCAATGAKLILAPWATMHSGVMGMALVGATILLVVAAGTIFGAAQALREDSGATPAADEEPEVALEAKRDVLPEPIPDRSAG